jgi:NAD(P)H-hydrate epimerase
MSKRLLTSFSREQCREVDRRAIDECGMSGLVLMENAGRGCADVLCELGVDGPVAILCGRGNNGGDGFVLARHLDIRGKIVRVVLLAPAVSLSGDARANLEILRHAHVPIDEIPEPLTAGANGEQVGAWLTSRASGAQWLIDAMLGTGAGGPPRAPFDAAIDWFNQQNARKMAIDVPSGLDCDTGQDAGVAVRAELTCTFVAQKRGYELAGTAGYTGEVRVLDIGAPRALVESIFHAPDPAV